MWLAIRTSTPKDSITWSSMIQLWRYGLWRWTEPIRVSAGCCSVPGVSQASPSRVDWLRPCVGASGTMSNINECIHIYIIYKLYNIRMYIYILYIYIYVYIRQYNITFLSCGSLAAIFKDTKNPWALHCLLSLDWRSPWWRSCIAETKNPLSWFHWSSCSPNMFPLRDWKAPWKGPHFETLPVLQYHPVAMFDGIFPPQVLHHPGWCMTRGPCSKPPMVLQRSWRCLTTRLRHYWSR